MRIAILAVILLSVSTTAFAGPGLAPPDPAFLDYLHKRSITSASGGHALGVIPSPVNPSRHRGKAGPALLSELSFPATYDLRTLGRVTPVKDQGWCSSCWAFATCGAIESAALPAETLDLSEMHLNCEHGFDILPCTGGNTIMAMAYMSRWSGPLWESDDPYNGPMCNSPTGVHARKRLQDVSFIPDRSGPLDNDALKNAIMTTGALYVTMSWDQSCYNESTCSYYYSGPYGAGIHAVCLVGWDDNYDKSLFLVEPPGNGAFICKNSWGTSWGDNGYFCVSYYDSTIGRDAGVIATSDPGGDIDRVYDYDPLGWVGNYGYYDGEDWFANVFTAGRDEQLMAASWYSAVPNCSYTVLVHLDPVGGPTSPLGPVATKSGTFSAAGYHILALDAPVALQSGHKFSVVVRNATPGYAYPIPVEYMFEGYAGAATSNPGESFVSSDGLTWMDAIELEQEGMFQANVCLKAFAGVPPVPVSTPVFDPDGGMFYDPPSVTITCPTEGATIHYTIDKTDPTELDPIVAGPILIDRNGTLKARAFKAGMLPSEVTSADFYIIQLPGLKDLPDDTEIVITKAIVTAAPTGYFYVEADDRSTGIRVNKSPHGLVAGMRADFTGQMKTNTIGERYVLATTVTQSLPPWESGSVEAILLANREVGGGDWHYNPTTGAGQIGVNQGIGLNNIGLLVTVGGEVTYSPVGPTYFVISDGSAVTDPSGYPGIRVTPSTALAKPQVGQQVVVTGICTVFLSGPDRCRQIRPRTQADIISFW